MIDTVDMGSLFKKIRLSKKLSLKDVAGDYLSVSFLSKFERGESEISLSRFFSLLENLDVSIEEFYGLVSKENPTNTEELLEHVSKAFYQNNILALRKYLSTEIAKYNETNKKTFLYNSIMIESFLVNLTGNKIDEKKIRQISDYLFDIDQWGKRELIIFGNSMTAIPTETLNILTKEIVYKTTLFGNNDSNKRIRISILINAISEFLDRNDLEHSKLYLDLLSEMDIPEIFLYEKLEYNIVEGSYWIKIGKVEIGKKKIEMALESLKNLGAENLFLARELYYENLLNSII
ncbi:helix-turn-helix domain-containing protein [Streptococcus cuniculipharyngis]|uniref:Helix-turn-helix domain-containing protein n=1 Tax=Streptococcus cuniculipharyngis TaxID=1562651 RepID=A0A5C5SB89_9STRE|nr:Rgg/GadR/MutR family transcriptional regulator [Streptococcus cuniculipharyngis]TWS97151.1 helix-turn-helix domain-containing protein [Streptococcus cuniculipharyngis]